MQECKDLVHPCLPLLGKDRIQTRADSRTVIWEELTDVHEAGGEEDWGLGACLEAPFHGKPSAFTWTVCELLSDSAGDHGAAGDREHECFPCPDLPASCSDWCKGSCKKIR